MNWEAAIDRQCEAVRRVIAGLVAMACFGYGPCLRIRRAGLAGEAKNLRRDVYLMLTRLLRPTESAVRRILFVLARDLPLPILTPAPARRRGLPILALGSAEIGPRPVGFVLADPLRDPKATMRRKRAGQLSIPRIWSVGAPVPAPTLPTRLPGPFDLIDATRISQRLDALARVMDDLPRHARRIARWKARQASGLIRNRLSPLLARAPGTPRQRGPAAQMHAIFGTLRELNWLAHETERRPDTS